MLTQTDLWDGRAQVLQVTEATGGLVRIRILVTAVDAPTLFDLRCFVREAMVTWLQRTMPSALPVQRVLITEPAPPDGSATRESQDEDTRSDDTSASGSGLFTGSVQAQERASVFTNAIPIVDHDEPER